MPLILGTNSIKDTGYNVANSVRLFSNTYLHKTPDDAGNTTKFTTSFWVKRSKIGARQEMVAKWSSGSNNATVRFLDDDKLAFVDYESSTTILGKITNRKFRDVGAWYHIVCSIDTTQSVAANRAKIFVNGVQETSFSTNTIYAEDDEISWNNTWSVNVGWSGNDGYMDGYMAEVVFIDGLQLAPTSFGEFDSDSGIWKPIDVSDLTFGTNGFYLDFEAGGNLGNDVNGGTDLTEVNLAAIDQSTDTCTNNFCTLNPLSANEMAFSNGNLDVDQASDAGGGSRTDDNARGTIGVKSGKWYWETKLTGATAPAVVGICFDQLAQGNDLSGSTGVYAIQNASATYAYKRENGTTAETAGFPNPVANNILSVAFDADNAKLYIGINGTYYNLAGATGDPAGGSNETFSSIDTSFFWLPWIESRGDNQQALMNFGSGTSYSISSGNADANGYGNFEYAVPSGYFALNTKNLAEYG